MIHRFVKRTGIESHLRVPIGNESERGNLREFESQYPFVDFLMKGFDHWNVPLQPREIESIPHNKADAGNRIYRCAHLQVCTFSVDTPIRLVLKSLLGLTQFLKSVLYFCIMTTLNLSEKKQPLFSDYCQFLLASFHNFTQTYLVRSYL